MLIALLLFYQKLTKDLEAIGLKVSPNDTCVAKKMISDKQMTITWRVDDLKVSHTNKYVVEALIQYTNKTYEDMKNLSHQDPK